MNPDPTIELIEKNITLVIFGNIAKYANPALYIIAVNVYVIVYFFL